MFHSVGLVAIQYKIYFLYLKASLRREGFAPSRNSLTRTPGSQLLHLNLKKSKHKISLLFKESLYFVPQVCDCAFAALAALRETLEFFLSFSNETGRTGFWITS
jgi:hypothetical protein